MFYFEVDEKWSKFNILRSSWSKFEVVMLTVVCVTGPKVGCKRIVWVVVLERNNFGLEEIACPFVKI